MYWATAYPYERKKWTSVSHHAQNITQKMIQRPKYKSWNYKTSGNKFGNKFCDLRLVNGLLDMLPKKHKWPKFYFIKFKTCVCQTISSIKEKVCTEWGKKYLQVI